MPIYRYIHLFVRNICAPRCAVNRLGLFYLKKLGRMGAKGEPAGRCSWTRWIRNDPRHTVSGVAVYVVVSRSVEEWREGPTVPLSSWLLGNEGFSRRYRGRVT
jgi:hypothetical protein